MGHCCFLQPVLASNVKTCPRRCTKTAKHLARAVLQMAQGSDRESLSSENKSGGSLCGVRRLVCLHHRPNLVFGFLPGGHAAASGITNKRSSHCLNLYGRPLQAPGEAKTSLLITSSGLHSSKGARMKNALAYGTTCNMQSSILHMKMSQGPPRKAR
jgi:hypothetical protein